MECKGWGRGGEVWGAKMQFNQDIESKKWKVVPIRAHLIHHVSITFVIPLIYPLD